MSRETFEAIGAVLALIVVVAVAFGAALAVWWWALEAIAHGLMRMVGMPR